MPPISTRLDLLPRIEQLQARQLDQRQRLLDLLGMGQHGNQQLTLP
jgi:hypothetical protein